MMTCKSPKRVLRVAYVLGKQFLPDYSSPFSRQDFTLPQLMACLVLKEKMGCSYREAEETLRDSPEWREAIGLKKTPDHNTLWRASQFLLKKGYTNRFLDVVAGWAAMARILGVSQKPLVADTTYFEPRPVSRHYEHRCSKTRRRRGTSGRRDSPSETTRRRLAQAASRFPKLATLASGANHLILAFQSSTGTSGDQPHWEGLLTDVRRRLPYKHLKVAADPGFDSHESHVLARKTLKIQSLIPALSGHQAAHPDAPARSSYRRQMQRQLATVQGRKASGYSQRAQAETVNSMLKRNLGSALHGKSAWSRKRDLHLKLITHDVMILD